MTNYAGVPGVGLMIWVHMPLSTLECNELKELLSVRSMFTVCLGP